MKPDTVMGLVMELYWIPPTAIGCWGWAWLCRNWATVKPIRLQVRIAVGLLQAALCELFLDLSTGNNVSPSREKAKSYRSARRQPRILPARVQLRWRNLAVFDSRSSCSTRPKEHRCRK